MQSVMTAGRIPVVFFLLRYFSRGTPNTWVHPMEPDRGRRYFIQSLTSSCDSHSNTYAGFSARGNVGALEAELESWSLTNGVHVNSYFPLADESWIS